LGFTYSHLKTKPNKPNKPCANKGAMGNAKNHYKDRLEEQKLIE